MAETIVGRRELLKAGAGLTALAAGGQIAEAATGDTVRQAIRHNHDQAIARLREWVAFPSIDADNLNYPSGAEYIGKLATDAGFQHVEIVPTKGRPGVLATLDAGAKRTLGVYFMYDVKQYDPKEWSVPPLEGRIIDDPELGKVMMGRGTFNQKGPEAAFLAALHAFKSAGKKLPVNLVLIAEGEEETGSPNLGDLVYAPQVSEALKRTVGVICPAASMDRDGVATIALGAKGTLDFELIVDAHTWGRGAAHDIHSSEKARVDSPPWHLVAALASLVSADGNTVMIDGVHDMVVRLTPRQRELIAQGARARSEAAAKKELGVTHWIDDLNWEQALVRLAEEPTVNIQGLVSGYSGPGGKTILPHNAVAKIEIRLVPDMTAKDTLAKLRAHLDRRGFQDIRIEVSGSYDPTQTEENAIIAKAARAVYEQAGVPTTIYPRLAGSWPGALFTAAPLSIPALSVGLSYGARAHAPDEFFLIESRNPKVFGFDQATETFVDYLLMVAAAK